MAKSKQLPDDFQTYARLSNQSYNPKHKRTNIDDWIYDPDQSSTYIAVYHDSKSNRSSIVNRGTKVTDVNDLLSDAGLIAGYGEDSKRVKDTLRIGKRLERNGREPVYVGHSYGGTVTYYAARKHNKESHSFNMGATSAMMLREVARMAKCNTGFDSASCVDDSDRKKLNVYTNSADPLSALSRQMVGEHHSTPSSWTNFDAHGLRQYGVPDGEHHSVDS